MLVELLEDHPVGRQGEREGVVDEAERGAGDEIAAVRVGLGHGRAEVAVGNRKGAGHSAGEGKVLLGEVAHRLGRRAGDESLAGAAVVGLVGDLPVVADAVGLAFGRHVEGVDVVARCRRDSWPSGWPSDPMVNPSPLPIRPEDVVERMVLHHHHDEVLDLRLQPDRTVRASNRAPTRPIAPPSAAPPTSSTADWAMPTDLIDSLTRLRLGTGLRTASRCRRRVCLMFKTRRTRTGIRSSFMIDDPRAASVGVAMAPMVAATQIPRFKTGRQLLQHPRRS